MEIWNEKTWGIRIRTIVFGEGGPRSRRATKFCISLTNSWSRSDLPDLTSPASTNSGPQPPPYAHSTARLPITPPTLTLALARTTRYTTTAQFSTSPKMSCSTRFCKVEQYNCLARRIEIRIRLPRFIIQELYQAWCIVDTLSCICLMNTANIQVVISLECDVCVTRVR